MTWCAYIEKHGSLNIGDRIEHSSAIVATVAANVLGKNKRKVTDFMPHYAEPEAEKVLSPEGLFGRLSALSSPDKPMRLGKE